MMNGLGQVDRNVVTHGLGGLENEPSITSHIPTSMSTDTIPAAAADINNQMGQRTGRIM